MDRSSFSPRRTVILLLLTALALMTLDARGFGPAQSLRRVTLTVTQPLRDAVAWATSPVFDAWNGAVHFEEVEAENDLLRARVAELEGEIAALPDTEAQLAQLLAATEIDYLADVPRVTGRVVADRHTGLERIVEVERGSDDGVTEGMPVVSGRGLVGRVVTVTGDRSVVRLITDPRFSVGVVDPRTGALGVTIGAGDDRSLVVDLAEASLEVADDGDRFETSGFERSRYPAGIPVGRLIVDADRDVRRMEPYADLSRLTYLTVLLVGEG